jgi:hypothetical protein
MPLSIGLWIMHFASFPTSFVFGQKQYFTFIQRIGTTATLIVCTKCTKANIWKEKIYHILFGLFCYELYTIIFAHIKNKIILQWQEFNFQYLHCIYQLFTNGDWGMFKYVVVAKSSKLLIISPEVPKPI